MEYVITALENMERNDIKMIDIYYAEDVEKDSENWSVDVMNDELNNLCDMNWTWTVMSLNEFKFTLRESNDLIYVCNSFEIIVDEKFSEDVVCKAINTWLESNEINIKTKMIDIKDVEGSGYIKTLKDRLIKIN